VVNAIILNEEQNINPIKDSFQSVSREGGGTMSIRLDEHVSQIQIISLMLKFWNSDKLAV
jgi:hypothetical protein